MRLRASAIFFMKAWNVPGALHSPKGMTIYYTQQAVSREEGRFFFMALLHPDLVKGRYDIKFTVPLRCAQSG